MIKVTNVTTKKYDLRHSNQDVAVIHIEQGEDNIPDTIVVDIEGLKLIQNSINDFFKQTSPEDVCISIQHARHIFNEGFSLGNVNPNQSAQMGASPPYNEHFNNLISKSPQSGESGSVQD